MKKIIILLLLFLLSPFFMMHGISQPPPPNPTPIPIDGGLLFLLVSGIIYGGKKFYTKIKEENNNEK